MDSESDHKRRSHLAILALLAAFLWATWGFVIEPRWVEVTRHVIEAPVTAPVVIAHLSDLHLTSFGYRERRILDLLKETQPDLIVLTGDTIDDGDGSAGHAFLTKLKAPLGVYSVLGNWEHWRPVRPAASTPYDGTSVTLLDNEARQVRAGIWIVGLDDATAGQPALQRTMRDVPVGAYVLAAIHSPAYFPSMRGQVNLALAGHTHGGQVRLPWLGAMWLPPGSAAYEAGWYREGGAMLYVSRGIGTSILPVRFLCRPELAVITLRPVVQ